MSFRSGFVAFLGRPNTGKSTLTNALVGQKVAITSNRPQTTRRAIRGIANRPYGQIVLVDTPGVHRPKTLLGQKLNELVKSTTAEVDVVALCLPADELIGPGDRRLVAELADLRRTRKVAVLTKVDMVNRGVLAERLLAISRLETELDFEFDAIVPVSAKGDDNVERLAEVLASLLPEGPALFDEDDISDVELERQIAELIREAALGLVREELPHSIAVVVDEMLWKEGKPMVKIYASLFVERESQKPIVLGKQAARLKEIGTKSRLEIEKLIQAKVMLDLRVKVAADWQGDPKALERLGFDF